MLHQLPPAEDVPCLGKPREAEVHRALPEALHQLQFDIVHPLLGRAVRAHGHHQLMQVRVMLLGIG